jgi:hypothetical protein
MEAGMTDAAERTLVERYVAAYNAFDIEGMLAPLAEEVRFEHHAGGQLTAQADGIAAFRKLAEQAVALFAEREQRITHFERDGASLAAGTLLELQGRSAFEFADGRIVRIVDRC